MTAEEVFKTIGAEYGFNDVGVVFEPFTDLKVRWMRTSDMIRFSVVDYLQNASDEVLAGIITCIFKKIRGDDGEYSPEAISWLTSSGFRATNQSIYISRVDHDNTLDTEPIYNAYRSLREHGLVEDIDDVRFLWGNRSESEAVTSVLMHVSTINPAITDEELLKFVVYRQCKFMSIPFNVSQKDRMAILEEDFRNSYPAYDKYIEMLKKLDVRPTL